MNNSDLNRRDFLILSAAGAAALESPVLHASQPGLDNIAPATGIRVRDYPITPDKRLDKLPEAEAV